METIKVEDELSLYRKERELKCFPVVNRGKLWYNTLTSEQLVELRKWYEAWLDVTETRIIPDTPSWVNGKINVEEDIL